MRSAMLSLLAISLLERFSRSESRTSCSRRLRLVTESVFRRRPWPVRMESTKPERSSAWDPETTAGDKRQSANQLVAGFDVSEQAFHTEAEKRKTVGILMLFADDDEARFGVAFKNIGEECASCGTCAAWASMT